MTVVETAQAAPTFKNIKKQKDKAAAAIVDDRVDSGSGLSVFGEMANIYFVTPVTSHVLIENSPPPFRCLSLRLIL